MRRLDGDRLRGAVFGPISHAPDRIRFASPSCCRARVQCAPAWGAALKRPSMTKPKCPKPGWGEQSLGHLQRPSCARAVRLGGGGRRRGDAHRDGADLDGKGGGQNRSRSRPLTPAEVSQRTGPRVWGSRKRVGRPSPRIKSRAAPINDDGLILRTFLSKG